LRGFLGLFVVDDQVPGRKKGLLLEPGQEWLDFGDDGLGRDRKKLLCGRTGAWRGKPSMIVWLVQGGRRVRITGTGPSHLGGARRKIRDGCRYNVAWFRTLVSVAQSRANNPVGFHRL